MSRALWVGAVVLVFAAGCGNGDDDSAAPAPSTTTRQATRNGSFALLDGRPAGYDRVAGSASLKGGATGSVVSLQLSGLIPSTPYIAHLHAKACADDKGGPHFKFDPDGSDTPPNEVHLAFTSDANGDGGRTVTVDDPVPAGARSVVLHENPGDRHSGAPHGEPAAGHHAKIACADLA